MVGWLLLLETALSLGALYLKPPADGYCDGRLIATNPGASRAACWVDGTACALSLSRMRMIPCCTVLSCAPAGATSEWGPIRMGTMSAFAWMS